MRIKELELQNLMSRQKGESTSEERKPALRTRDLDSGASKQKRVLFDWFRPRRDDVQKRSSHDNPQWPGQGQFDSAQSTDDEHYNADIDDEDYAM